MQEMKLMKEALFTSDDPSILDKLVEKRHIMLFSQLRIEELKILMSPNRIRKIPPTQREFARRELRGRIRELLYLRRITGNKAWSDEIQRLGHVLHGMRLEK